MKIALSTNISVEIIGTSSRGRKRERCLRLPLYKVLRRSRSLPRYGSISAKRNIGQETSVYRSELGRQLADRCGRVAGRCRVHVWWSSHARPIWNVRSSRNEGYFPYARPKLALDMIPLLCRTVYSLHQPLAATGLAWLNAVALSGVVSTSFARVAR